MSGNGPDEKDICGNLRTAEQGGTSTSPRERKPSHFAVEGQEMVSALHESVRLEILRRVNAKEYIAGELLPSAAALANEFSVSAITVKRALRNPESAATPEFSIAALGRSPALAEAKKRLAQLAGSGAPLLLRGERGMRAELFARMLAAPGAPFLAGGELLSRPPSELLAKAAGGVVFIPDLSRLGHAEQRNLEFLLPRAEKHRVRVVSFSPFDVRTLAEKCDFDPELGARLGELTLKLPSVRDFGEDVPDLASRMLVQLVEARACPPRRFAIAALNALRHHGWPGNLAELESVVKDLALSSLEEEIQLDDVTRVLSARAAPGTLPEVAFDRPYREAREAFERVYFEHLLARENGSMSRVADRSGLERTHLYRKLKALGLPVGRREEG